MREVLLSRTARPDDGWIQTFTGRQYWPHSPSPSDIATPTKRYLSDYNRIEELNAAVIAQRFGIAHPTPVSVKHADRLIYWHERRQLMPPCAAHPEPDYIEEIYLPPLGLAPEAAEAYFLAPLQCSFSNTVTKWL
jgi:hypothetical protein